MLLWEREPNLVKVVDLAESLFKRHTGLIALHHDVQIQILMLTSGSPLCF